MSMPNDKFVDKNRPSIILEEYKICSSRADHLTTLIWSLATALLSLSAGALFLTGQLYLSILDRSVQPFINFRSLVAVCILSWIVALISSLILIWWNDVADRWHNTIKVWYHRMKELELALNMWCNRDIDIKMHSKTESQNSFRKRKMRYSKEGGQAKRWYETYSQA